MVLSYKSSGTSGDIDQHRQLLFKCQRQELRWFQHQKACTSNSLANTGPSFFKVNPQAQGLTKVERGCQITGSHVVLLFSEWLKV